MSLARLMTAMSSDSSNSDSEENSEQQPLIELQEVLIHQPEDVDEETQETFTVIHQPAAKSFFYPDIKKCLAHLKEVQKNIPEIVDRQEKILAHYSWLAFFNLMILAIASPGTFMKLMFAASENIYNKLLPGWKSQLNALLPEFTEANNKYLLLENLLNQYVELWHPALDDCQNEINAELSKANAGDINNFVRDMCLLEKNNITLANTACNNLATQGCDMLKHPAFHNGSYWDTAQEYHSLRFNKERLEPLVNALNERIYDSHFTTETIEPFSIALFIMACIAAVAGTAYYCKSYYDAYGEYQEGVKNAYLVSDHIENSEQANLIINLISRLNLKLENLTVDDFIERLEAEAREIDLRWKCRIAFLDGSLRSDADNHNFLLKDGARDCTKRIFEEAELGAVKPIVKLAI